MEAGLFEIISGKGWKELQEALSDKNPLEETLGVMEKHADSAEELVKNFYPIIGGILLLREYVNTYQTNLTASIYTDNRPPNEHARMAIEDERGSIVYLGKELPLRRMYNEVYRQKIFKEGILFYTHKLISALTGGDLPDVSDRELLEKIIQDIPYIIMNIEYPLVLDVIENEEPGIYTTIFPNYLNKEVDVNKLRDISEKIKDLELENVDAYVEPKDVAVMEKAKFIRGQFKEVHYEIRMLEDYHRKIQKNRVEIENRLLEEGEEGLASKLEDIPNFENIVLSPRGIIGETKKKIFPAVTSYSGEGNGSAPLKRYLQNIMRYAVASQATRNGIGTRLSIIKDQLE